MDSHIKKSSSYFYPLQHSRTPCGGSEAKTCGNTKTRGVFLSVVDIATWPRPLRWLRKPKPAACIADIITRFPMPVYARPHFFGNNEKK
jgi:hypothetical protein